jgi:hypothetical protein
MELNKEYNDAVKKAQSDYNDTIAYIAYQKQRQIERDRSNKSIDKNFKIISKLWVFIGICIILSIVVKILSITYPY